MTECFQIKRELTTLPDNNDFNPPDNTYLFETTNTLLRELVKLIGEQRAQDKKLYKQPGDEENYRGTTVIAVAGSVTTVTWTFVKDYIYYFSKIYVDSHPDCTFTWTFGATTESTGVKVVYGNEHNFDHAPIEAKGNSTLTLDITNSNATTTITLDLAFLSWARRAI